MAEKHTHQHPDTERRIKALEKQMKKLEQEVRNQRKKLESHDHPHTH